MRQLHHRGGQRLPGRVVVHEGSAGPGRVDSAQKGRMKDTSTGGVRHRGFKRSLRHADGDRNTGQAEADQQHAQEEEVGAGRPERTCGRTAVLDQRQLERTRRRQQKFQTCQSSSFHPDHRQRHLFDVEYEEVLDGADGGQHRAVEGANPADGLTINDLQHVLRNGELLLAPPIREARFPVSNDQPEWSREARMLDGMRGKRD